MPNPNVYVQVDMEEEDLDIEFLDSLRVTMSDFKEAIKGVPPSALKDVCVELPSIRFADIGGLEDVKRELQESKKRVRRFFIHTPITPYSPQTSRAHAQYCILYIDVCHHSHT